MSRLPYQSFVIVGDCDEGAFLTLLLLRMHLKPSKVLVQQFFTHKHICNADDTDRLICEHFVVPGFPLLR